MYIYIYTVCTLYMDIQGVFYKRVHGMCLWVRPHFVCSDDEVHICTVYEITHACEGLQVYTCVFLFLCCVCFCGKAGQTI